MTVGNRGLGYEICRQLAQSGLTVLLGARDLAKCKSAAYRAIIIIVFALFLLDKQTFQKTTHLL